MNNRIILFAAVLFGAAATFGAGHAQQPSEAPAGDLNMGHHHHGMDAGSSDDGAFHRRFNDAEKWAKEFDKPERDEWQKPDRVVDALKLAPDAAVADIGAGTGYFSMRIARAISGGTVFAADVEPDMVQYLGARAKAEGLANVKPVLAGQDAANLPEPVDLVLVVDTYHHIGYRTAYFKKLKASLKPGGRLVIIDFRKDSPNGPPVEHRIAPETAAEELKAAGFSLVERQDFLPRQYFLVFKADS